MIVVMQLNVNFNSQFIVGLDHKMQYVLLRWNDIFTVDFWTVHIIIGSVVSISISCIGFYRDEILVQWYTQCETNQSNGKLIQISESPEWMYHQVYSLVTVSLTPTHTHWKSCWQFTITLMKVKYHIIHFWNWFVERLHDFIHLCFAGRYH